MKEELSDEQKDILNKLTNKEEAWTVRQIAKSKHTTTQAIYKIISKLRYRGYLLGTSYHGWATGKLGGVASEGGQAGVRLQVCNPKSVTTTPIVTQIRVHAHQWLIKLIAKIHANKYKESGNKAILYETHWVKCHKESIEIYCHDHWKGFTANSEEEADRLANEYWLAFMRQLEVDMGVLIVKQGSSNITRVKAHYSHIENGVAYYYKNNVKQKLQLIGKDGKEWLVADFSHGINELDFTHSRQAKEDSIALKPHLDAMREKGSMTVKELAEGLKLFMTSQKDMLDAINALAISQKVSVDSQTITNKQIQVLTGVIQSLIKPVGQDEDKDESKDKPNYIG